MQSSDDGLHISDEVDGIDGMGLSNFHKNPAMAQSRLSVLYIGAGGRPPIFIFVCGGETPRTVRGWRVGVRLSFWTVCGAFVCVCVYSCMRPMTH